MRNILYLECYSGISGDMTVGALLDLGAHREVLEETLCSMGIEGYHLHFGRKKKCGIDAYNFDVELEKEQEGHDHHTHHSEEHIHKHEHRHLSDILEIIERLKVKENVKQTAKHIFQIVAEAEAKAHGIEIEEVHFHEVGAIDSIIDILSTAICLDDLGIEEVIVSPLSEGHGYVTCQHGVMPVPVPATANIAAAYGLELRLTDNEGEMVTPTGAAIAAAIRTMDKLPEKYKIKKIGIGAGNKDFKNANILRAMLIEPIAEEKEEKKWILETNIDDSTPEALGYTMECLLEAGASDVWYMPIYMKKSRPAFLLKVICEKDQIERMEDIIFVQTTTIGIRKYQVDRKVLDRRIEQIMTKYGEGKVKICNYKGQVFCYPEYESIKEICNREKIDFQKVYIEIKEAAEEKFLG